MGYDNQLLVHIRRLGLWRTVAQFQAGIEQTL
jgi:hypothetical protein